MVCQLASISWLRTKTHEGYNLLTEPVNANLTLDEHALGMQTWSKTDTVLTTRVTGIKKTR